MANIKESDLYNPIVDYFSNLGFKVNGEVMDCDMTAFKEDTLIVIELKKNLNIKLLTQGVKRQKLTDLVYLAIPRPKGRINKAWKDRFYLLKRLGLGLIFVSFRGKKSLVQVIINPKSLNKECGASLSIKQRERIINEINGRSENYNIGGSNKTKIITAYRESAIHIACCLNTYGRMSTKELRALGTGEKTTSILYTNVYGWFNRIDRGVYELNNVGKKALNEFSQLVTHYNKIIGNEVNNQ